MNFTNKNILITGGATGIGLSIATEFANRGAKVLVVGRRESKLNDAKSKVPALHTFVCDVTNGESVQALFDHIKDNFGGLDMLVNNAGVFQNFDILKDDQSIEVLEKEVQINLLGPIRMIKAMLPLILKSKEGAIMNVSSGLAYVPISMAPVYCSTKAAIHSFTISLRRQLSSTGIKVFELMPPLVDTEMVSDFSLPKMKPNEVAAMTAEFVEKDKFEIRPGQSKGLYFMSRYAPGFIEKKLNESMPA